MPGGSLEGDLADPGYGRLARRHQGHALALGDERVHRGELCDLERDRRDEPCLLAPFLGQLAQVVARRVRDELLAPEFLEGIEACPASR